MYITISLTCIKETFTLHGPLMPSEQAASLMTPMLVGALLRILCFYSVSSFELLSHSHITKLQRSKARSGECTEIDDPWLILAGMSQMRSAISNAGV
jgi:hypothetical protein